jgi:hypothetical protein
MRHVKDKQFSHLGRGVCLVDNWDLSKKRCGTAETGPALRLRLRRGSEAWVGKGWKLSRVPKPLLPTLYRAGRSARRIAAHFAKLSMTKSLYRQARGMNQEPMDLKSWFHR